jgi:N6-L-threonylcarbamoyladenine synthase
MKILAIETSCDETSVAILENGTKVLANLISSQVKAHAKYGGVVPELASRMHTENIHTLLDKALDTANLELSDIDACAVTYGPGLEGALLVGLSTAKTLAHLLNIPLIPVNHLHGHIYANFLNDSPPAFPFICMIVSGGHTMLTLVKDHFNIEILGQTRDDAAGEAFDKVARYLELGYPGGPIVEQEAENGNEKAYLFPKPMLKQGFEFSFSGLKTAVIQTIQSERKQNKNINTADVCASFQKSVIDTLSYKAFLACKKFNISKLVLSGGVTANSKLRETFELESEKKDIQIFVPEKQHCTDNAAMIGAAAYYFSQNHDINNYKRILTDPNARIDYLPLHKN